LLFGRIADVYGKRLVFLAGSAWFTIVTIVCPFMPNEIAFDVFRGLQGLASAATMSSALGILGATFKPGKYKNYAFAIYGAGAPLGSVFGNIIAGLIGEWASWKCKHCCCPHFCTKVDIGRDLLGNCDLSRHGHSRGILSDSTTVSKTIAGEQANRGLGRWRHDHDCAACPTFRPHRRQRCRVVNTVDSCADCGGNLDDWCFRALAMVSGTQDNKKSADESIGIQELEIFWGYVDHDVFLCIVLLIPGVHHFLLPGLPGLIGHSDDAPIYPNGCGRPLHRLHHWLHVVTSQR
jgi:hypothetical protein